MGGTTGRYDRVARATMPGELPSEGHVNPHCQIAHGVVPDPNPAYRGQRQRAAINIKTDALEFEYARGRISEGGYQAALTYGRVLERSRVPPSSGGSWSRGDRVDQVVAHDLAIAKRIDNASAAVAMLQNTARILGMQGQRILDLVLVDKLNIRQAALKLHGREDRQAVIYWATLFRTSCELLSDHWCSRHHKAPR